MTKKNELNVCEAMGINLMGQILDWISTASESDIFTIELSASDKDAKTKGWPSLETEKITVQELIRTLPEEIGKRVVSKNN